MIDDKFKEAIGILHIPEDGFRQKMDALWPDKISSEEQEERMEFLLWQKESRRANYEFCFPDYQNNNLDMAEHSEMDFSALCKKISSMKSKEWQDYKDSGNTLSLDDISREKAKAFYERIYKSDAAAILESLMPADKNYDSNTYIQTILDMMTKAEWEKTQSSIECRKILANENEGGGVASAHLVAVTLMLADRNFIEITNYTQLFTQKDRQDIFDAFEEDNELGHADRVSLFKALKLSLCTIEGKPEPEQ